MNRIILSGLLLSAIAAVSFCETCTPDQWEGEESSVGGYVYHRRPGTIMERNFISYDAKNKRKAVFITYVNDDHEYKFQMVVRHDDEGGRIYVADLDKGTCWTKSLEKSFRKACIPEDAKSYEYYMGLKGKGGLLVTGYFIKKGDMEVFFSATKDGDVIIPIGETVRGHFMRTAFMQSIGYINLTPGIKNETVFDVPAACKEKLFFGPNEKTFSDSIKSSDRLEVPIMKVSGDLESEYLLREHLLLGL